MYQLFGKPIPVTSRPKARICGRSLAGIAGSNLPEDIDVCLLWVLRTIRQWSLRRTDHSSIEVVLSELGLSLISKPPRRVGLGPLEWSSPEKKLHDRPRLGFTFQLSFSHDCVNVRLSSTAPKVAGKHLEARGKVLHVRVKLSLSMPWRRLGEKK